jgi:hypothetical protein
MGNAPRQYKGAELPVFSLKRSWSGVVSEKWECLRAFFLLKIL